MPRETLARALNIVGLRDIMASRRLRARSRAEYTASPCHEVPNKEGQQLMHSGQFGSEERRNRSLKKSKQLARQFLEREMGCPNYGREAADMGLVKQVGEALSKDT